MSLDVIDLGEDILFLMVPALCFFYFGGAEEVVMRLIFSMNNYVLIKFLIVARGNVVDVEGMSP